MLAWTQWLSRSRDYPQDDAGRHTNTLRWGCEHTISSHIIYWNLSWVEGRNLSLLSLSSIFWLALPSFFLSFSVSVPRRQKQDACDRPGGSSPSPERLTSAVCSCVSLHTCVCVFVSARQMDAAVSLTLPVDPTSTWKYFSTPPRWSLPVWSRSRVKQPRWIDANKFQDVFHQTADVSPVFISAHHHLTPWNPPYTHDKIEMFADKNPLQLPVCYSTSSALSRKKKQKKTLSSYSPVSKWINEQR